MGTSKDAVMADGGSQQNPYRGFDNLYDLVHWLWDAIQSEDAAKRRGDEDNRLHHENRGAAIVGRIIELRPGMASYMPTRGSEHG